VLGRFIEMHVPHGVKAIKASPSTYMHPSDDPGRKPAWQRWTFGLANAEYAR
jgi:hypothetical protein